MALFEFEDGRLVPAQFGYPVAQDLGPELVDAICQQVLQIVSRPLFPVTWRDMTGQGQEETPRLTALDVTGQIVSVEILKELDSDTLIASLSRLAEVASISWADLANEYPSGPEGFRIGWAQFRDSMPPAVGPGPRLIMVAGEIDPSVRPALSLLATSGVEVHLMNLRQMSNGRLFLDVNAVGPRLYGHAPQVLASAAAAPELTSGPSFGEVEQESLPSQAPGDRQAQDEELGSEEPGSEEPGCEEPDARDECDAESDGETPTTRPTPKVAPHLRDVFSYPASEEPPAPWQPSEAEGASDADLTDEAAQGRGGEADAGDDAHADGAQDADAAEQQETSEDPDEGAEDDESPADLEEDRDSREAEENDPDEAGEADADDAEGPAESSVTLDPRDGDRAARAQGEGELPGGDDEEDSDAAREQPEEDTAEEDAAEEDAAEEDAAEETRSERPAHLGSRASRRAQIGELNDAGATYAATDSFVDHAEESVEVIQAREEGVPVLSRDESGLRALAQILGEDTPLVARSELGLPADLMLEANGAIFGAGLTYPSLDTLLTARGLGHIQAWALVRIGDRLGPTLAEALDEINREIVREYSDSPRGRRSARH